MARISRNSLTRLEIIKTANRLFLENGFTATTMASISKELEISTGNLTYHFPTKEHLLLELVEQQCQFQWDMIAKQERQGASPLQAYVLEITAQTALCDENPIAKDFYVSAYTHPLTLAEIRRWDCEKAQNLFAAYNPEWKEVDYVMAESSASGLELAALMTESDEMVTLEDKIANTLDGLLRIYHVPETERRQVIADVLADDYHAIGQRIWEAFGDRIEEVSDAIDVACRQPERIGAI